MRIGDTSNQRGGHDRPNTRDLCEATAKLAGSVTGEDAPIRIDELPLHERYYVYPGIKHDLENAGFRNVMGFGVHPGRFSSSAVSTGAPLLLLYAVKP